MIASDGDSDQFQGGMVSRLYDALDSTADGAFVVDNELRVVYWNKAAEKILGFTDEDVTGRFCYQLFQGHDEGRAEVGAHGVGQEVDVGIVGVRPEGEVVLGNVEVDELHILTGNLLPGLDTDLKCQFVWVGVEKRGEIH